MEPGVVQQVLGRASVFWFPCHHSLRKPDKHGFVFASEIADGILKAREWVRNIGVFRMTAGMEKHFCSAATAQETFRGWTRESRHLGEVDLVIVVGGTFGPEQILAFEQVP